MHHCRAALALSCTSLSVISEALFASRKLEEILDPVHRYNLGDRAAFIALERKIESRAVEEAPGKMGRRSTFGEVLVHFWYTFGKLWSPGYIIVDVVSCVRIRSPEDRLRCLAVKNVGARKRPCSWRSVLSQ